MSEAPLPDVPRVDAHDKVRGAILFGADHSDPTCSTQRSLWPQYRKDALRVLTPGPPAPFPAFG